MRLQPDHSKSTQQPMKLKNASVQGMPFQRPETSTNDFFDSIGIIWNELWTSFIDFITGKNCSTCLRKQDVERLGSIVPSPSLLGCVNRQKSLDFFDLWCHIQYVCLSWIVLVGLFLAIFPPVLVLLWFLHQKELFDPLYDWWEDICGADDQRISDKQKFKIGEGRHHIHDNWHRKQDLNHPKHVSQYRQRSSYNGHKHKHSERDSDYYYYYYYLHRVQKDIHKHGHNKIMQHVGDDIGPHKHPKERDTSKRLVKVMRHNKKRQEIYDKYEQVIDKPEARQRK